MNSFGSGFSPIWLPIPIPLAFNTTVASFTLEKSPAGQNSATGAKFLLISSTKDLLDSSNTSVM